MRAYGLSEDQAIAMPQTSFLGELRRSGEIAQHQYEAALAYEELWRSYLALFPIRSLPEAGNLDRGGGYDASDGTEPDYVERVKRITAKMAQCREALRGADKGDFRASWALEKIVLDNARQPHAVGSLRIALNAIARVFEIPLPGPRLDKPGGALDKSKVSDFAPAG